MKEGSKNALKGSNEKCAESAKGADVDVQYPCQKDQVAKNKTNVKVIESTSLPFVLTPELIDQLNEVVQVREAWDTKKFLQVLRCKESDIAIEDICEGFEAWRQQLEPMNEINEALGIKPINLDRIFENKELQKKLIGLKLNSDYFSTGAMTPLYKATKIIFCHLLTKQKDPDLQLMLHILMLTYLNMEKINEILVYRLAGYNIMENEFQKLMTEDFEKYGKQIQEIQRQLEEIKKSQVTSLDRESRTIKVGVENKLFGLIRKTNSRINGLVRRIESAEDIMEEASNKNTDRGDRKDSNKKEISKPLAKDIKKAVPVEDVKDVEDQQEDADDDEEEEVDSDEIRKELLEKNAKEVKAWDKDRIKAQEADSVEQDEESEEIEERMKFAAEINRQTAEGLDE